MRAAVLSTLVFIGVLACGQDTGSQKSKDEGTKAGKTYHLYFLGGQSNMEGFGYNSELPADFVKNFEDVYIYNGQSVGDGEDGGGAGIWAPLSPGFGFQFSTDGKTNTLSDRFGPELSFAATLKEIHPDRNIAIIKYARGGSGLAIGASGYGSWDPDYAKKNQRNQYDNALTAINGAFANSDVDGDGLPDTLLPKGIIWMQGEADAFDNESAVINYEGNLRRMMNLLRASFRVDDLPVVIGKIKDSGDSAQTRVMKYSPEIQQAQAAFVEADSCAALVTVTDNFGFLPDKWHYLSENYLTLGEAFANSVFELDRECL